MWEKRIPDGRKWLKFDKGYSGKISAHFTAKEFQCQCPNYGNDKCKESPCDCKYTPIDPQLVAILENIREHFGKPVNIYSGYRCNTHNSHVSNAASNSRHRAWDGYSDASGSSTGVQAAVDMGISGVTPHEIAQYAERIGVYGIGKYSDFVHLDTRLEKSFWLGHEQTYVESFGTPKEYIKATLPTYRLSSDSKYVITNVDETESVVTSSDEVELTLPEEPSADFSGLSYNSNNKPVTCWQSDSSSFTGTTIMDIKGIVIHSSEGSGDTVATYVQPSNNVHDRADKLARIGSNTTCSDWNHKTISESYNACIGK